MRHETLFPPSWNVPRYTSYPTAPHFHGGVDAGSYANWLWAIPDGERVSLYIHVPFCDRLCWFCACHTKQTQRYDPVLPFLSALRREIGIVGGFIGARTQIASLHFGGGSPTLLKPEDLNALMRLLRRTLTFAPDAEISIEIDPSDMDEARLDAMAEVGVTRASLGIQDFDPRVQAAINREQSYECTRDVVEGLRARGIAAINLDLLYGLPLQTYESVRTTLDLALSLKPDRMALFGYAHVPWMKKHQKLIDETTLPGPKERVAQSAMAAEVIAARGYLPIGIDHFALPGDPLAAAQANGRLHRNFQGYTDDECHTLIGLGPSSISRLRQGYAQNVAATGVYQSRIAEGRLATERGIAFTDDDMVRGWVIERLMCDFGFGVQETIGRFGPAAGTVLADATRLAGDDTCPYFIMSGDRFHVTEDGRQLVRTVAARFDAYFGMGQARHSLAV
ncbi:oxygen-independent coproporphyrinogen III oxidase [Mesorhizobium sp. Z1-4]|uniref:oxygen-independent coproporphyrinogen III oxidase n=1 Tax=Mesorhizobium sp. Z1-4 TaxID=2448478 RepID=UPI000FDAD5BC|nr:oxygen-independent coproporphyrinogen III oxidase [Mesorhizobium sp. Z1-4]